MWLGVRYNTEYFFWAEIPFSKFADFSLKKIKCVSLAGHDGTPL
jgi:hypothetical protein